VSTESFGYGTYQFFLNLWLFQCRAPTDGREVEVVVNRFEFVPG
jgi:hypothetical protein